MEDVFDPSNITPYLGKSFITKNSRYNVIAEGKISGKTSLNGANIMMIAGIKPEDRGELLGAFHHSKETYDRVFKEKASPPEIGKSLAISLTPEDANERCSSGLVSSVIERIE